MHCNARPRRVFPELIFEVFLSANSMICFTLNKPGPPALNSLLLLVDVGQLEHQQVRLVPALENAEHTGQVLTAEYID